MSCRSRSGSVCPGTAVSGELSERVTEIATESRMWFGAGGSSTEFVLVEFANGLMHDSRYRPL